MSSRIPSSFVRRFDYRLSSPLLLSRRQWEQLLELAELNHWDPFPLPGFSFSRYRFTINTPAPQRELHVDYDDFVLDISIQIGRDIPPQSSLTFLSDGILLTDDIPPISIVIAFWMLGPYATAVVESYILCFTVLISTLPADLEFQRLVVPTRHNLSSFRFTVPQADMPILPVAWSLVNRFVPDGEPIPVP
jgi:hypothetical protein